jgi:nucleoside-diphosphate-sugar epimerase
VPVPKAPPDYAGVGALVLGASGFIGRWLARGLGAAGARLHLVVRDPTAAADVFRRWGVRGEVVSADLARPGELEALLRSVRPSITFNLAGYGVDRDERDVALAERINAALVEELVDAVAAVRDPSWAGLELVHVGSALEYGALDGDLAEDAEPEPTTAYGRTKLAGTRAVTRSRERLGLQALTARLFSVYGPGEHPGRLLPSLLQAAGESGPLALSAGLQERDFVYVEDVAEGLLRLGLCDGEPGPVLNLATGVLQRVRAFVEIAASILGIAPERLDFGALATRPEEMAHAAVSVTRLRQVLGWLPGTDVETGVRRTLAFLRGSADPTG